MKNLIAYRKPTGWSTFLSVLISLTFMITWLPFIRSSFDGDSYVWGTAFFGTQMSGAGFGGDYPFLVFQLLFYCSLFASLFWAKNRLIYYVLLVVWYITVFGSFIADIIVNGDQMFHGDTLNVHISITWIIVPLAILALILIGVVIRSDMKASKETIPWNSKNTFWMLLILSPLPVQAFLLAYGEPHDITDQIGVLISIVQCFLIPIFLRPRTASPKMATA
jgi:hypothetical protein